MRRCIATTSSSTCHPVLQQLSASVREHHTYQDVAVLHPHIVAHFLVLREQPVCQPDEIGDVEHLQGRGCSCDCGCGVAPLD